jgi:actin-like ATPase involved in cell morphogenesis
MKSRTELEKNFSRASTCWQPQSRRDDLLKGKKLVKAIWSLIQIDSTAICKAVKHVLFRIFTSYQLKIKTIPPKLREKIWFASETLAKGSMSLQNYQST